MEDKIQNLAKKLYPDNMGGLEQSSVDRYRAGYIKGYKDALAQSEAVKPFEDEKGVLYRIVEGEIKEGDCFLDLEANKVYYQDGTISDRVVMSAFHSHYIQNCKRVELL